MATPCPMKWFFSCPEMRLHLGLRFESRCGNFQRSANRQLVGKGSLFLSQERHFRSRLMASIFGPSVLVHVYSCEWFYY